MPYVSLPTGTRTYYEFHRGGQTVNDLDLSKPTVVLIHAAFSSLEQWRKTVADQRFGSAYNFVLFDSKHHGRSTGPIKAGYDYPGAAAEIAMAMDQLGVPPSDIVGETYDGCRRVLQLAQDRPDLVTSLVLISPGVFKPETEEAVAAVVEMLDLITATNQESIASGIPRAEAKIPYEVSSGILAYHFSDTLDQDRLEEERATLNRYVAGVDPDVTREIWGCYIGRREPKGLDNIKQPVMILRGTRNEAEAAEENEYLWRDAFTDTSELQFHLVHGAPCVCTAVAPLLVNRYLLGWLDRNSRRKRLSSSEIGSMKPPDIEQAS